MLSQDVVRAWKDPVYRAGLSAAEQAALPAHPARLVELNDAELIETSGGTLIACVVFISMLMAQCAADLADQ